MAFADGDPHQTPRPRRRYDDGGTAYSVRDMVLMHDHKIDSLEEWRSEIRGVMTFIRIVLGTSIVSLIVSIVTIVALASGWRA